MNQSRESVDCGYPKISRLEARFETMRRQDSSKMLLTKPDGADGESPEGGWFQGVPAVLEANNASARTTFF